MKTQLTILFLIVSTVLLGQYKRHHWPYIKGVTPRYLSVYGGVSGRNLNQFEIGLGFNIPSNLAGGAMNSSDHYDSIPPKERPIFFGFVGPTINYRFDPQNNIDALAIGVSMKSGFNWGLDFVTYRSLDEMRYAIKPQIGLYIFHVNLEYGFNIFLNKTIPDLRRGDFRIGINVPIIKLIKE